MTFVNTKNFISKRIYATLIDYTLTFGFTIFLIYQIGAPNDEGGYTISGAQNLFPLSFWFLYFIIAEFFLGGTLGHQIFKLKIVSADGNKITLGQICLRRISDLLEISWCFGLVAFILVKNTPSNQRLGDLWAKTLVTGIAEQQDH